jgi:hypothetical protein
MLRRVAFIRTDVSVERIVSIIWEIRIQISSFAYDANIQLYKERRLLGCYAVWLL